MDGKYHMNYYEILDLDRYSSTKDIRRHYYALSKIYHPDKNRGQSDDKFKSLSEAYTVLSNPKKRYIYDMNLLLHEHNIVSDFEHEFTDGELNILHKYYMKITESTEFRFIKILYNSLPHNIRTKMRATFPDKINSHTVIATQHIKYIYVQNLNENFEMNLNRTLHDVYLNQSKEIIVVTKTRVIPLFITHSDYSLQIYLHDNFILTINIITVLPENYSMNGHDLHYNHRINLYEYYFEEVIPITLPNNVLLNLRNTAEFNTSLKVPNLGLKHINERGDLYIYKNLDLTLLHVNINHYRSIMKEIFAT